MGFGYGSGTSHSSDAYDNESGNRVKKTFSNDMTAHIWAQNSQTFGQSNNGNFFFHGPTLFSYGDHFVVGHIMPDGVVLLNSDTYSISATRQQSDAAVAVRHLTCFRVPGLTDIIDTGYYGDVAGKLASKAKVRKWAFQHITSCDAAIVQYLLGQVGLARSYDKIKRDAAKSEAASIAARGKAEFDTAFNRLATVADVTESEFTEWRACKTESESAHVMKLIRSAQRKVRKAGISPRRWNKVQARLKLMQAHYDALTHDRRRAETRVSMRKQIGWLRTALFDLANLPDTGFYDGPLDSNDLSDLFRNFGNIASHASALAGQKAIAIGPELQARLATLASNAELAKNECNRLASEAGESERREKLDRWQRGEPVGRVYARRESGAAYIRASDVQRDSAGNITGGKLETSQGADVPLVHAVKAFRFIKLVKERGQGWQRNGAQVRVGHFTLDSIDTDGNMKAGCHNFEWQDIEALATRLGVFELPPSDDALSQSRVAA